MLYLNIFDIYIYIFDIDIVKHHRSYHYIIHVSMECPSPALLGGSSLPPSVAPGIDISEFTWQSFVELYTEVGFNRDRSRCFANEMFC